MQGESSFQLPLPLPLCTYQPCSAMSLHLPARHSYWYPGRLSPLGEPWQGCPGQRLILPSAGTQRMQGHRLIPCRGECHPSRDSWWTYWPTELGRETFEADFDLPRMLMLCCSARSKLRSLACAYISQLYWGWCSTVSCAPSYF